MERIAIVLVRIARAILWPVVRLDRWLASLWDKLDQRLAHRLALPRGTRVRITCPECNGTREGRPFYYAGDWVIDYFCYDPGDYHLVRAEDFKAPSHPVHRSTYPGRGCVEVVS